MWTDITQLFLGTSFGSDTNSLLRPLRAAMEHYTVMRVFDFKLSCRMRGFYSLSGFLIIENSKCKRP